MTRAEWSELRSRFQAFQPGWQTPAVLTFDGTAVLLAFCLYEFGGPLGYLAAVALSVWILLHLYLLLHEATHSAISRSSYWNDLVGHLCGWIILMPYATRRRSHLLHHVWTGHPIGDPANERIIRRFTVLTPEQAASLERVWKSWMPVLTLNDRIGLWRDPFQARKSGSRNSARLAKEIRANYLYWTGYAGTFLALALTGELAGFLKVYLPAFFFLLGLEELANLPHHAETPLLEPDAPALPYWEQGLVTHSCKSVPFWSRFVLLNFNLHTAHHLFPWVPWHDLPQAHEEIRRKVPGLITQSAWVENELEWSLRNRKRRLLEIMGHYFDRIPKHDAAELEIPRPLTSMNPGILTEKSVSPASDPS